jgi:predicted secreted Zn-dependent protease
MSVATDPKGVKFKTELNKVLSELFQEQRQRGRDFDRLEMSQGGNVHQLILGLVNSR